MDFTDESMNLRKSFTRASVHIFPLFLSSFAALSANMEYDARFSEHPVYSATFAAYLNSKARTEYQKNIVERILDLSIDIDQAKQVISRVPFLAVDERLHLFQLLDKRSEERAISGLIQSSDGRKGFISIGEEDERRKILKKFLLAKVRTEEDYSILIKAFDEYSKVLDLFMAVRRFDFLDEASIELAKKIAHGQIDAYFSQAVEISEYAEQAEISSVRNTGFTRDLPKVADEYARYRYQYRTASTFKEREFYAEIAGEVGNDSLREEDRAQIDFLRLEWKGAVSELIIGDQFIDLSTAALNRDLRGITWTRNISGHFPSDLSIFAGIAPIEGQEFGNKYDDWTKAFGINWAKNWGPDREIGIFFISAEEESGSALNGSQVFGVRHQSKLSRQLNLLAEMTSSFGSNDKLINSSTQSYAGLLELDFDQDNLSGLFKLRKSGADYISVLGLSLPGTIEIDTRMQKSESWGTWSLFGHFMENEETQNVVAHQIFRPGLNLHINSFLGISDLYADYGYDESREESSDLSVLLESNNHWIQFSRNFDRLRFDASLNYREYYDINVSQSSNKEGQIRFSTHGHFFHRGRAISPAVELSAHRHELISGRIDERRQGAIQLTSQILRKGQLHTRYDFWRNESAVEFQNQQGQSFKISLDYPFERDWKRSLKFDYNWEEQNLNSQLSSGSQNELKLSYNKRF